MRIRFQDNWNKRAGYFSLLFFRVGGIPTIISLMGFLASQNATAFEIQQFYNSPHNTTPRSGRDNFYRSRDKARIPARRTVIARRFGATIEQHTRRIYRNYCTSTPPLVATPLCCHPPSESQANREGTKGGGRGANQGSLKTTITPSMPMEPPLKAHPGS